MGGTWWEELMLNQLRRTLIPPAAKKSVNDKACFAVLVVALEDQIQVKYIYILFTYIYICCSHIPSTRTPYAQKDLWNSDTQIHQVVDHLPHLSCSQPSFSTPCQALWGRTSACCKFEKDIWVHQSKHGAQQLPTGCGHADSLLASTRRCLGQLNKLTSSPCFLALSSLRTVVHTGAEFLHWS